MIPYVSPLKRAALEALFPGLKTEWYFVSSPEADWYNCVAWACNDDHLWWEAETIEPGYHWPDGAPVDGSFDAYAALFALGGYEQCEGDGLEPGYEKVALYNHPVRGFSHVAWQNVDGRWWSKLGDSFDMEHESPHALESDNPLAYGKVDMVMKRQRKATRSLLDAT